MLGVARRCPMGEAQNARLTQLHVPAETTSITCNAVSSDLFACASESLSETPPRLPKNKQGSLVTWAARTFMGKLVFCAWRITQDLGHDLFLGSTSWQTITSPLLLYSDTALINEIRLKYSCLLNCATEGPKHSHTNQPSGFFSL